MGTGGDKKRSDCKEIIFVGGGGGGGKGVGVVIMYKEKREEGGKSRYSISGGQGGPY